MKKMYRVKKVAEVLALNEETVRKLLKEGTFKGTKLGTHWRVAEDELKRILGLPREQQQRAVERTQKN